MVESELDKGTVSFQAEGRLLQELGLRLVAKPEVALVELIKNAYDADSPSCVVRLDDDHTLVVADEGHGMTITDFKNKWMRVATTSKLKSETSPKYHRPLTGAKGIGRFAVRYLGDHLTLQSCAFDKGFDCVTRLEATFDWSGLDKAQDISTSPVPYTLVRAPKDAPIGTILIIRQLRSATDFTQSTDLRDDVLRIVSPLQGLERGRFAKADLGGQVDDPGFTVYLPGERESADVNLAKLVLDNYWGRLTVELTGRKLFLRVWLPGNKKPRSLDADVSTDISKGFFADIRYFPRRKGIFHGKGVHGQKAWRWVRDNCGVKVVDHGFHLRPYGFPDDDWLRLDLDKAHSERDWKTDIAKEHFPLSPAQKAEPKSNPVLYLPYNFQLVGAVFVETRRAIGSKDEADLIPAMDREGLLENSAYEKLRDCMRAGIEFLAHEDKAELDRRAEQQAKEAAQEARQDMRKAIRFIESLTTLTPGDKARVIKRYQAIADRLDDHEAYSAQSRQSLLTMSLLGVVAGFMMHESKAIVHDLEEAAQRVGELSKKHPQLKANSDVLEKRLANFKGYLDYARMFVGSVRAPKMEPLSAAAQVRHVMNRFEIFASDRGIKITSDIDAKVMTPPMPVTVYSGILLNLFTNALKAVIAVQSSSQKPHITFRAWNEKGNHIIEVADNGVGIPPELHKRIWEPLYTTTSDVGNPLGSGMGLGLTLIKQVVSEFGGTISLFPESPPGFNTCFRIIFPNK